MKNLTLMLVSALFVVACSGTGGGDSDGGTPAPTNKFTVAGSSITVDDLVSAPTSLGHVNPLATSQVYYGRVFYKSGANYYGGTVHFTLNKHTSYAAYFSNFYLDYLAQINAYGTSTPIVTTSTDLSVTAAYNPTTNYVSIQSGVSRFVSFSLDFGNNTNFADVTNAGVIFSSDFSTMVGGNNSSFFFIAQKASSQPTVAISDITGNWSLANFTVNGSGAVNVSSTSTVSVTGTGGNNLTAFTGTNSISGAFQGETALSNSTVGNFAFGFDTFARTPPTADGTIDGSFLLSANKNFILGINTYAGVYFAASK